ncbi:NUDIX domain-containing protein [Pontibacillus yanchengensis]|uniref:8-oxo-dGTP diphosphatase n=2 Tax=Pontibacillus yanchengensis TaxID=462910 RepID=A0A6I4ZWD5_9BACI|nr:(deoxy)nucleoside triphosphate pyrophosphohydrolase [Pontibacillus yanchengensis]MYL32073.1 NUDIX domain-containing protein [Pontibacillus yanchengensis]MYL52652.1 NUDIX domain-containing protein [Pontibacillus yanchengensis]
MKQEIYVVGAVIIENNKILCAQRGYTDTMPLVWEFPGGKIEEGESPQEALYREVEEEMDCTVEIGEQVEHTVYEYDFAIVHLTTYYCKLLKGEPVLKEHAAFKWLSPGELLSIDWAPADMPAIEKLNQMSF